ncbi:MAG: WYL domain-containing protein [Clostridia bacterium]|nr:WYL domain-containing protein [Clostridia bacterium]
MATLEAKAMAPLRILQILHEHSDCDHPLTQANIADYLERDYGIIMERKAIGRHIKALKGADYPIEDCRGGSYLGERDFEDAELRMLIDGVLSSKYIAPKYSADLIEKLCKLSNKRFRSHVKNIYSVNDWSKTDNKQLFGNIDLIDDAIEQGVQLKFQFNKYGVDKKLHRSSNPRVTPYQLILHNQRYYLMASHAYFKTMFFYRVDHITNMEIVDKPAIPITDIKGFEGGIDYKTISSALPYMYTDQPRHIELRADKKIIDQIIDWFGTDIFFLEEDENHIRATVKASPMAMEHWATQYIKHVEVLSPSSLRKAIKESLAEGIDKYK